MLQRIATGPELSKDLSEAEAELGMSLILSGEADPVQSAIYLIALRMKRETAAENRGTLSAIRARTHRATANVPELIDIADPYSGYNRTLPSSPFLAPVLAACGLPALSQGVHSMGPKFGVTHHQILAAAGVDVSLSPEVAAERLTEVGWAYVDQASFCPSLHDLTNLRTRMVKRPVITTVEVLTAPVVATQRTHLMTGFVHKPYPPIYSMLARHAGFYSCLLSRGVEGGVVPSLRQAGRAVRYVGDGDDESVDLDPVALGIESELRAAPIPEGLPSVEPIDGIGMIIAPDAVARTAVHAGVAALTGRPGAFRDGLIYAGALALWHCGKTVDMATGAERIRGALDDGSAADRFRAGGGQLA